MELKKSLRWEIDNFSEREDVINSDPFSSGRCQWRVYFYTKGFRGYDYMYLYLGHANPKLSSRGWKRRANFRLVILNQSGKELYKSPDEGISRMFCAEVMRWGFPTMLTRAKLQEEGLMEKDKLTIEVYINVVKVVHGGKSTAFDIFDFNGFDILAYQFSLASEIFRDHPDFAKDFKPKNQGVKRAYMNLLLSLTRTLSKSPKSVSVTERSLAQSELTKLTEAGFKLDWLKPKLEELSLVSKKKTLSGGSLVVQQLEERVKNVEVALLELKVELKKEKIKYAAAKVTSFNFVNFFIKRFFLSCFSIS